MNRPRPNASADDQKIAEMCRWLKAHRMIGLGTRNGNLYLIPAAEVRRDFPPPGSMDGSEPA